MSFNKNGWEYSEEYFQRIPEEHHNRESRILHRIAQHLRGTWVSQNLIMDVMGIMLQSRQPVRYDEQQRGLSENVALKLIQVITSLLRYEDAKKILHIVDKGLDGQNIPRRKTYPPERNFWTREEHTVQEEDLLSEEDVLLS